jgi:KaiC/GvpD/RAD55 family RecA-like ATPase
MDKQGYAPPQVWGRISNGLLQKGVSVPSLIQARRKVQDAGLPIYQPFKGLEKYNAEVRRGQLSLLVAGPGAGKSIIAQYMLSVGDKKDTNSVLYFCSDTPPDIMMKRAGSIVTGYDQSEVARLMEIGASAHIESQILKKTGHIEWEFRSHITPDYVLERIKAYIEMHDAFPEIIVVDVLRDLSDAEDADEFRALEDTSVFLRDLAAETGAAVMALHHVNGEYEEGSTVVPLKGVRGRVSKTPSLILTLHRPEDSEIRVSIVKNRNGQASASGKLFARLNIDFNKLKITG